MKIRIKTLYSNKRSNLSRTASIEVQANLLFPYITILPRGKKMRFYRLLLGLLIISCESVCSDFEGGVAKDPTATSSERLKQFNVPHIPEDYMRINANVHMAV